MRAIIIGALAAVALASFAGYKLYYKPHRSVENEAYAGVSASGLYAAFKSDETEANNKYLDKVVLVDGTVSEIFSNQDGKSVLLLKSDDPLFGISCTMRSGVTNVKAGAPVKVKGICTGYLSDVVLTDGLLIED